MRILHVTDSYLPTVGGIELHVRDLVQRQRAAGHVVTVATRTPSTVDDVRRVDVDRARWLEDVRPDVVHAHVSVISPFALTTARRSALQGLPTVVTVHSLWTHLGPLPGLARELWGMRRWDVIWTAVSERAAQPVRELLGVPVLVVPNAVDLGTWTSLPERASTAPPNVLSVMRLTSVKRAVPLVGILRRVAREEQFTATIVGDGPERGAVQRYLRRHGLDERVRLTGALERAGIRELLHDASVFVAPAHRESFGIAALEARACGVPVVASSRSGVGTFVEHGTNGLLGADDREMGDHLSALLADPDLRARLARHSRGRPPAFGWEQALERNHHAYLLAMARAGRTVPRSTTARVLVG